MSLETPESAEWQIERDSENSIRESSSYYSNT